MSPVRGPQSGSGFSSSSLNPYLYPVVPLRRFSSVAFDGVTDVAPAINAALESLRDAGGGLLGLPVGVESGILGEPIILQNLTGIAGGGKHATVIQAANGMSADIVQNYQSSDDVEANGFFTQIRDLKIDGNKAGQTVGSGIAFNASPEFTQATNDPDFDSQHLVSNVFIYNCKEDGVGIASRSDVRLYAVTSSYCDGYGFYLGYDTIAEACTSGHAGLAGFYIPAPAVRVVGCKAFYSGNVTAGSGYGFRIEAAGGAMLTACEAQDNKASGFALIGTDRGSTLSACLADSNGTTSAGTYPGFDIYDSQNNHIEGVAYERAADGSNSFQTTAVQLRAGSIGNVVVLKHYAAGGANIDSAVHTGSDSVAGNRIAINNEGGYQTGTYAASYTPNPRNGSTIAMTLTGNITINAVDSENFHIGSKMRFIFTQDGTGGRTVTWNAAYKVNWTPTTTAGKVNTIEFEHNGAAWIQVASAVNL